LCDDTECNRRVHPLDGTDLRWRVAARAFARGGVVAMVAPLAIARYRCLERAMTRLGAMACGARQRLMSLVLELRLLLWIVPAVEPSRRAAATPPRLPDESRSRTRE